MKEDLISIEYLGARGADFRLNPLSAHFEVHIEQERRLQDQEKEIGIVTGIQGVRWYTVVVSGEQGHAGSTPMKGRADALVAAAEIIIRVQKLACLHDAVGTVGVVRTEKSSANKIAGYAEISIDFRHPDEAVLDEFEFSIKAELARISSENSKFALKISRTWRSPVANFNDLAVECVRFAAVKEVGAGKCMEMISFAGHDSALVSEKTPTAMIFIPCRDGISHSPLEHSTKEQWYVPYPSSQAGSIRLPSQFIILAAETSALTFEFADMCNSGHGAQVLLTAVLNYDAMLYSHDKSLGM